MNRRENYLKKLWVLKSWDFLANSCISTNIEVGEDKFLISH